jgi:hypothetical protein
MTLPSPSTKQNFLPLVAEPHPRFDKTSSRTTANQSICTSITEPPTISSQDTQAWYQTPPNLNIEEVVEQTADQDPLLPSSLPLPPHNDQSSPTSTGEEPRASGDENVSQHLETRPWPVPHAVEHQKHSWYGSMLGMGAIKVKDEWGFSSTSVSRSHTPDPDSKQ